MRTTVDIDDELIVALKEIAHQQGATLGQVISELTRRSLPAAGLSTVRNGVRLFTPQSVAVKPTLNDVNALRDET